MSVTRTTLEKIAAQLSEEEMRAFGISQLLYAQEESNKWRRKTEIAISLASNKLKLKTEDSKPMADDKQQIQEVTQEVNVLAARPQADAGAIMVSPTAIGEIAAAITQGVGQRLRDRIKTELEKVGRYAEISTSEDYTAAAELRKALKKLSNEKGDVNDIGRARVRVSVAIIDGENQQLAVMTETTIGIKSAQDFYNPLAAVFDALHDAATLSRGELDEQIEAGRSTLETAILTYQQVEERKRKDAEQKERIKQEQAARVQRANHWIGQLAQLGFTRDQCLEKITGAIETVTDADVNKLSSFLTAELTRREEAKQKQEIEEAVQTARDMGMNELADELEGKKSKALPTAFVAPAPPPPPIFTPGPSVAQSAVPKVKGMGGSLKPVVTIENPELIPRNFLLPREKDLYDASCYPRVMDAAKAGGARTNIPGVTVKMLPKLTQR